MQQLEMSFSEAIALNTPPETVDEAIDRVEEHADQGWKSRALFVVRYLCTSNATLTTDDVWRLLDAYDDSTHEPRAMGSVMRQAAKRGWCEPTDRTQKSTRPECHRRPIQVWHSLIQGRI